MISRISVTWRASTATRERGRVDVDEMVSVRALARGVRFGPTALASDKLPVNLASLASPIPAWRFNEEINHDARSRTGSTEESTLEQISLYRPEAAP
jgi:hypothetical protein